SGTKASRSESPKRVHPNAARLVARPGKAAGHGGFSEYMGAPPESIKPQEGVGSAVPSPRKLSEASVRMALPNCAVKTIKNGAMTFGTRWRTITRRYELPMAHAAST